MNELPPKLEDTEESNVIPFAKPKLNLDLGGPTDGDWLSSMTSGTEFKCRDKTGRSPRWLVNEFTHMGKLKGDVLLAPTVQLRDPKSWFWVDPIEFCKQWEFRGIIEIPDE